MDGDDSGEEFQDYAYLAQAFTNPPRGSAGGGGDDDSEESSDDDDDDDDDEEYEEDEDEEDEERPGSVLRRPKAKRPKAKKPRRAARDPVWQAIAGGTMLHGYNLDKFRKDYAKQHAEGHGYNRTGPRDVVRGEGPLRHKINKFKCGYRGCPHMYRELTNCATGFVECEEATHVDFQHQGHEDDMQVHLPKMAAAMFLRARTCLR